MSRVELMDEDDDIYSYFNKSVSAVQVHADHFEQEYARPALRTSQAFFDRRPIVATFIAIFVFLSVLPAVTFLGLALFAVTSFTIIALTSTVILSATVVLTLLSLLILTLLITLASATFLTVAGVSIYAFASLLNLVRLHGNLGIGIWMDQMSDFVFGEYPVQHSPQSTLDERECPSPAANGHNDAEWTDTEDNPDPHDRNDEFESGEKRHEEEPDTPSSLNEPLFSKTAESAPPPSLGQDPL
ncbi:hypothetical protein H0H87_000544 [Tephrocybe sp. NHM501043]|nr:hypothetical protein H0H87_000544 [Tephrocybe sp. NHM501043]